MRWLRYLAVLALWFAFLEANSSPLVLDAHTDKASLSAHVEYLRDPGGLFSVDDINSPSLRSAFLPGNGNLNFGLTRDTIWLRIEVIRTVGAPVEWWLEVAPAYLGELAMFVVSDDRTGSLIKPIKSGMMLPFSDREFKVRNSTFKTAFATNEPYVIYLKIRSTTPINVRATLWQPLKYAEDSASVNIFLGIYLGAILIIFVLSAMLWRLKRVSTDFWWMIYIAAEALMMCRVSGLISKYIFPEHPLLITTTGIAAMSVMIWAGAQFGLHAFALAPGTNKFSYHAVKWVGNLALVVGVLRILDSAVELTALTFLLGLALCVLNCILSLRFFQAGHPSAVYYFGGIWSMTASASLMLARNFGIVPAYEFIDYVWQFNLIIHTVLMSLGMLLMHRETITEQAKATAYRTNAETNLHLGIMRKRMVALVSHEFRNALAMVSVTMHAINKRKDLPPDITEKHKDIVRIHQQMRRVIDNFLTEDRMDGAELTVSYRKTDIRNLIEEVVSFGNMLGKNNPISFDISDVPAYLWIDDAILRLILTNLVDNAVKYSHPGGTIFLAASMEGRNLKISVKDNGIGMTSHSLSQLFQPHFKADMHSEGVGLGLYMVKMMIEAHGGRITVVSRVEEGSAVEFRLKPEWAEKEIVSDRKRDLNNVSYPEDYI